MNYYPFHIGDYLSATRHLSWIEDAAYRRLLDTYYVTEKPLPDDLRQVFRLVLATTEEQREAVKIVLDEFFELTPDGWINRRSDAEIAEMQRKQKAQRDKANKRWHKQKAEPGNASAMPRHTDKDAAASNTHAEAMPPTPTPTPYISTEVDIKNQRDKTPRFDAQAHLVDLGVPPLIAGDWITLRKSKKAPVTQTAIRGIESEAGKAGISIAEAMATCCQRGWAGFKAEWIEKDQQRKSQYQINQDATTRAIFGSPLDFTTNEKLITGEVVR